MVKVKFNRTVAQAGQKFIAGEEAEVRLHQARQFERMGVAEILPPPPAPPATTEAPAAAGGQEAPGEPAGQDRQAE